MSRKWIFVMMVVGSLIGCLIFDPPSKNGLIGNYIGAALALWLHWAWEPKK